MTFCCAFGERASKDSEVIYRSGNFFISPALGQFGIEGYVLVCSNEHHPGISELPDDHYGELEGVTSEVRRVVSEAYDSHVLMFEHGPMTCKAASDETDRHSGQCIDHAHLHVIPTDTDVMAYLDGSFDGGPMLSKGYSQLSEGLKRGFQPRKIDTLSSLKAFSGVAPYLFVETQGEDRYVLEVKIKLPSQFLRQLVAFDRGVENLLWDWAVNPDFETFEATHEKLKGRFKK